MSLKHAILGFLSFKPLSGYDLKKAFDRSVRHFWPADQSQIYRTLKQLHKAELISMDIIPRDERLDVKVYAITEVGQVELDQWLSTPLPPSDTREPFLIQIYFAFMLKDDQAAQLIQTEIDRIDELMPIYKTLYQTTANQDAPDEMKRPLFYSTLTLEYGINANQWYRQWLQNVKDRIDAGEMTIFPLDQLLDSDNTQE